MTLPLYLSYFDEMLRPTEPLFLLVPADKIDWVPVEGAFTCGQMIAHMAGALGIYADGIVSGEWGFQSMKERMLMNRRAPSLTVEEAIREFRNNREKFFSKVGALTEDKWMNGEIVAPQFGSPRKRWRVGMLAVEHHLDHKAELFMYLKLLGVRVHTGTLYRG